MMSLLEFYNTVPGDIFVTSDYLLKQLVNLLIFHFLALRYHHRHNQMLQILCADGSYSEGGKEELIKAEAM